ncbi:MAG: glycosyltransferase [Candidatus Thorarchaeota archaeon]
MTPAESICTIIVNFKTPDLIKVSVETFVIAYPKVETIVVNNGGCKDSVKAIVGLAKKYNTITPVYNQQNVGHGPALRQGIAMTTKPYVFLLDSDTKTRRGTFLEMMLERFEQNSKLFSIGWVRYVNHNGVASPKQELKRGHPYVHTHACLMDRRIYSKLDPLMHSGAPAIATMRDAIRKGYELEDFAISDYIWHKVAGTRGRFGGRWNVKIGMPMKPYRKHRI